MKATKTKSIQKTVTPIGYTGRSFNIWQRHITRQIDKIKGTDLATKYLPN